MNVYDKKDESAIHFLRHNMLKEKLCLLYFHIDFTHVIFMKL